MSMEVDRQTRDDASDGEARASVLAQKRQQIVPAIEKPRRPLEHFAQQLAPGVGRAGELTAIDESSTARMDRLYAQPRTLRSERHGPRIEEAHVTAVPRDVEVLPTRTERACGPARGVARADH